MRRNLLIVALLAGATPAAAQARWTSAPIHDIAYEVTADSAAVGRRQLALTMTFGVDGAAPVVLALPAWSPGHYVLVWFASRVTDFSVESGGVPLPWRKLDYQTWRIEPRGAGPVRVTFRYRADAVDRAIAWTAADFAFFNGTNLFLYPVGRGFDWPARVSIRTEPDWRIATGMEPGPAARSFQASNYHDLVDMPFYVGRFAIDSTRIAERWFRLAMYPASSMTPARRDRILGWLTKLAPVEIGVFGEAPFRNYTVFLRSDTVVNGGGLEHQSSQVDEVLTSQLDGPIAGLFAHEMFHAWNVKRLRPADLVPYRYDDAQPTPWLWVSEGITDYYGGLAQTRSGISDEASFYEGTAGQIATDEELPPTALGDASLAAWIGASDNTAGLYYPKGALVGFLLDIMIRDASDNAHSLDGVMRSLYQETYKRGTGFTGSQWWSAVQRAANGRSFSDFARRYVDGRERLPVDSVLALAALRVLSDTVREPRLGIQTRSDTAGVFVAFVTPGGAASIAGLLPGDLLVSIGDVPITGDASFDAFRARYAGTSSVTLPLLVRRASAEATLTLPVRLFERVRTRVEPVPGAPAKAVQIRSGILHGR